MTTVGQQRDQHAIGKVDTKSAEVLEKMNDVNHQLLQMNKASLWFKIQLLEGKEYVVKSFILSAQMELTHI
jgi:hypothetical protein